MTYTDRKLKEKSAACLLCNKPTCSCVGGLDYGKLIKAVRFDNLSGAYKIIDGKEQDFLKYAPEAMKACRKGKKDRPVDIEGLVEALIEKKDRPAFFGKKADLSIDFCGVHCENPFFLSSSVVGSNYDMVARAFDMGWAGVAFKTIGFFVPDEVSPRFATLEKEDNPFIGFKNLEQISDHTLEENLEYFRQLKKDYPTKVIIASIMGANEEEWTKLARLCEEAGADIIECNFSCPQMVGKRLGSEVGINNELVELYTSATRKGTKLPILAKMTPNITNMVEPAKASALGGASGIAAINTIKSIVNVDLDSFVTAPDVAGKSAVGGYSGKAVKPIALRFIHDMKKNETLRDVPISGMGGIETWRDAAEFIALGCETVQVTTAVMQYGYRIIEDMIQGLSDYMISHRILHVKDMVGRALPTIVPADVIDRKTIEYPKFDRDACIGCGRCYLSCRDGGHQAISQSEEDGKPTLIPKKCVGCQLCVLTCPMKAISRGLRINKKN